MSTETTEPEATTPPVKTEEELLEEYARVTGDCNGQLAETEYCQETFATTTVPRSEEELLEEYARVVTDCSEQFIETDYCVKLNQDYEEELDNEFAKVVGDCSGQFAETDYCVKLFQDYADSLTTTTTAEVAVPQTLPETGMSTAPTAVFGTMFLAIGVVVASISRRKNNLI